MQRNVLLWMLSILLFCTGCSGHISASVDAVSPDDAETEEVQRSAALSDFTDRWAKTVSAEPEAVKVLLAHEMLCHHCTYDPDVPDCHSADGALLGGRAVCDGYAKGFSLLMDAAGIPVRTVIGFAIGAEGILTAHAWNLVKLEGQWYHIDCTWDDSTEVVQHTYFLCDDSVMQQTHFWDKTQYPPAEGSSYRYETIAEEMEAAVHSGITPLSADKNDRKASGF